MMNNKKLFIVGFFLLAVVSCTSNINETINSQPENQLPDTTKQEKNINKNDVLPLEDIKVQESPKVEPTLDQNQEIDTKDQSQPPSSQFLDNKMDFVSQAPYEVWDEAHKEACEEASMVMVDYFLEATTLGKHEMEQGILKLLRWEEQNGYTIDVTADEVQKIMESYFQIQSVVKDVENAEDIIQELQKGNIIIVPAAGRLLGNPYFRSPGPLYHMLVIRGFDKDKSQFITNDPGTKRGEAYRYSFNTLFNAIHDWPRVGASQDEISENEMNSSPKKIIIIER